jgi:glycosyltransferase involved in cell wall biosynthesis
MVTKRQSISVFFPFLNDWGTVGSLIGLAVYTVSRLTDDWEVIVINDGSKDEDREALEKIVKVFDSGSGKLLEGKKVERRIKIINHEKNRGYGGALRAGFAQATKDLIFYTDCDAQYDPRELELLFNEMSSSVAMVNGYKIKRNDPWHRIIAGRLYHYFVKFAFGLPIEDTDCDFRLIRRDVFDKVKLFENTGTICVELVKKISCHNYKIAQVPVHHYWRTSGKSQFFNFPRLYKTGTNLLKLWWKLMVKKEYYS